MKPALLLHFYQHPETQTKREGKKQPLLMQTPSASTSNSMEMFMVVEQPSPSLADSPELNSSQPAAGKDITATLASTNEASTSIMFAPGELKQFQTMMAANGQTDSDLAPAATGKQSAMPLNKADSLLTLQLQAILAGDSQGTLAIRTSYQSAPAEALNGLSSPYIQSADSAVVASILPAHAAMQEGAAYRIKTTESGESLHQNLDGRQYLSARLEEPADKNNAGNQQDSGRQEDSAGQAKTAHGILTALLGNNEQTGHSFATAFGAQVTSSIPGAAPAAHPASLSPGVPIAAEEVINNLVERFSINPRRPARSA
ncbi:MAG: hypothetical protein K0A99_10145 [Desulfoarculaceae bacterium]|nr:hypothetical protein [Desulfoarculaceae bacterium]